MPRRRQPDAFTLVELLLVVVVLGILAAVVIPQFNTMAAESRESGLSADLATMRKAIELYQTQHDGAFPGRRIIDQLTKRTDITGRISPDGAYGPYVRQWPYNPADGKATISTAPMLPRSPNGSGGWIYATSTGQLRANTPGAGPSNLDYFDL